MGMCKECKEVFGVTELTSGYCKKCVRPELVAEHEVFLANLNEKKNYKSNISCGIILSILSVVLNFLAPFALYCAYKAQKTKKTWYGLLIFLIANFLTAVLVAKICFIIYAFLK